MFSFHSPSIACNMHAYGAATGTCVSVHEQAVGGFPLGSGLVVEDGPSKFSCTCISHFPVLTQ